MELIRVTVLLRIEFSFLELDCVKLKNIIIYSNIDKTAVPEKITCYIVRWHTGPRFVMETRHTQCVLSFKGVCGK